MVVVNLKTHLISRFPPPHQLRLIDYPAAVPGGLAWLTNRGRVAIFLAKHAKFRLVGGVRLNHARLVYVASYGLVAWNLRGMFHRLTDSRLQPVRAKVRQLPGHVMMYGLQASRVDHRASIVYYSDRSGAVGGNPLKNPRFEFRLGPNPDLSQERARHLAKERFHQIQPRAMRGRVDVAEAVGPASQIGACLLGNMGRMIVKDHPYDHMGRVMSIHIFEQRDEFPAAMPVLDPGHDMPVVQIQRRQNGQCSMPLVLIVAAHRRMLARNRRSRRAGIPNRLHPRLFINGYPYAAIHGCD